MLFHSNLCDTIAVKMSVIRYIRSLKVSLEVTVSFFFLIYLVDAVN